MARFGAEFFRGLPRQPGVYLMRDAADRLIYVGKAKNLRQRLNSYRYPQRASRKTLLVAQEELDQLPARTNLDRSPPHP